MVRGVSTIKACCQFNNKEVSSMSDPTYFEQLKKDEPVFDGHPLNYFANMTSRQFYRYKIAHPGFEDSWVFEAVLRHQGPIFNHIARTGEDA